MLLMEVKGGNKQLTSYTAHLLLDSDRRASLMIKAVTIKKYSQFDKENKNNMLNFTQNFKKIKLEAMI